MKRAPNRQSFGVYRARKAPNPGMGKHAKIASLRAEIHGDGTLVGRLFQPPVVARKRFTEGNTGQDHGVLFPSVDDEPLHHGAACCAVGDLFDVGHRHVAVRNVFRLLQHRDPGFAHVEAT